MKTIALNLCEKNCEYVVERLEGEPIEIVRRLSELGFVKGTSLKVIQYSALKKTMLIELHGYVLSLRASVASIVKVKRI